MWDPIGSGDMVGAESGCFNEGDEGGSSSNSNAGRGARRLTGRQRGRSSNAAAAGEEQQQQREYPPPLTTSVTHRDPSGPLPTARRRFNLFRRNRTSEDGQRRLVVEARERVRPETEYYMRTQRNNGRLTISLENLNLNENESDNEDDNDDDNGGGGGDYGNTDQVSYQPPDQYHGHDHDAASSSSSYHQSTPSFPFFD